MQVENAMTLAAHSIFYEGQNASGKCNDPGTAHSIFYKVKMQVENAMTLAAHSILHAVKMQVENFNDPGCTYA
jgi:hypothetical protein